MKRALPAPLVLAVFLAVPAVAEPFAGSELLVGRGVKQPAGAKVFAIGINASVSPMDALLGSQKDTIIAQGISEACAKSPDPATCKATAQKNADLALTTLAKVPDSDWARVQGAAGDPTALEAELRAAGISDPTQLAAIKGYVNTIPAEDRTSAVALSRKLASQSGTNILLEPNFDLNFKWIALRVGVPMTISLMKDSVTKKSKTYFNLGDINLDAKTGYTWDFGAVALNASGGVALYLPTGTGDSNASALSDPFQSPKYTKQYITVAPYIVGGFDLFSILVILAHLEMASSSKVRSGLGYDSYQYLKWGTGLVILPKFMFSIVGEINGLVPIANAAGYDAIFAVGGIQFKLFWFKLGVAVQAPIKKPKDPLGSIGGMDIGTLSAFSVMSRFCLVF